MLKQEAFITNAGIKYVNIPLFPFWPPSIKQIRQFLNIVNSAENLPVYVHCREGKDRTGIMTAIYRVVHYNYNFEQAFSEMLEYGHHASLFPLLRLWLYKFCAKNIFGAEFTV